MAKHEEVNVTATQNHYERLGLTKNADIADIKKAHRKLILKTHSDHNQDDQAGADAKFVLIQEAYDVLTDPLRKSNYDAGLSRSADNVINDELGEMFRGRQRKSKRRATRHHTKDDGRAAPRQHTRDDGRAAPRQHTRDDGRTAHRERPSVYVFNVFEAFMSEEPTESSMPRENPFAEKPRYFNYVDGYGRTVYADIKTGETAFMYAPTAAQEEARRVQIEEEEREERARMHRESNVWSRIFNWREDVADAEYDEYLRDHEEHHHHSHRDHPHSDDGERAQGPSRRGTGEEQRRQKDTRRDEDKGGVRKHRSDRAPAKEPRRAEKQPVTRHGHGDIREAPKREQSDAAKKAAKRARDELLEQKDALKDNVIREAYKNGADPKEAALKFEEIFAKAKERVGKSAEASAKAGKATGVRGMFKGDAEKEKLASKADSRGERAKDKVLEAIEKASIAVSAKDTENRHKTEKHHNSLGQMFINALEEEEEEKKRILREIQKREDLDRLMQEADLLEAKWQLERAEIRRRAREGTTGSTATTTHQHQHQHTIEGGSGKAPAAAAPKDKEATSTALTHSQSGQLVLAATEKEAEERHEKNKQELAKIKKKIEDASKAAEKEAAERAAAKKQNLALVPAIKFDGFGKKVLDDLEDEHKAHKRALEKLKKALEDNSKDPEKVMKELEKFWKELNDNHEAQAKKRRAQKKALAEEHGERMAAMVTFDELMKDEHNKKKRVLANNNVREGQLVTYEQRTVEKEGKRKHVALAVKYNLGEGTRAEEKSHTLPSVGSVRLDYGPFVAELFESMGVPLIRHTAMQARAALPSIPLNLPAPPVPKPSRDKGAGQPPREGKSRDEVTRRKPMLALPAPPIPDVPKEFEDFADSKDLDIVFFKRRYNKFTMGRSGDPTARLYALVQCGTGQELFWHLKYRAFVTNKEGKFWGWSEDKQRTRWLTVRDPQTRRPVDPYVRMLYGTTILLRRQEDVLLRGDWTTFDTKLWSKTFSFGFSQRGADDGYLYYIGSDDSVALLYDADKGLPEQAASAPPPVPVEHATDGGSRNDSYDFEGDYYPPGGADDATYTFDYGLGGGSANGPGASFKVAYSKERVDLASGRWQNPE